MSQPDSDNVTAWWYRRYQNAKPLTADVIAAFYRTEGRCKECGWVVDADGHSPRCSSFTPPAKVYRGEEAGR